MAISPKNTEEIKLNLKKITSNGLTWVDIVQPTEEVKKYLTDNYHFNPLDIEDCLSTRQLSKVEEYPDYLFVIFHLPVYEKARRISIRKQWSAFVCDNLLITLRPGELRVVDDLLHQCEINEEVRQEYLSHGSAYLLYRILDTALDAYFPVMEKISSMIDDLEDDVFKEEVEVARQLSILRRDIITQRRVMFPTRKLLVDLENKLKRFTPVDLTIYYSDLMDHMNQICETLDEFREVIEVFKDADYLLSSYRANRVIRILAVIGAVSMPFLVVAGIYQMLPGGAEKGSIQLLLLLLAIILIAISTILYLFRRRHLI